MIRLRTALLIAAIAFGVSFVVSSMRATRDAHRLDEAHAVAVALADSLKSAQTMASAGMQAADAATRELILAKRTIAAGLQRPPRIVYRTRTVDVRDSVSVVEAIADLEAERDTAVAREALAWAEAERFRQLADATVTAAGESEAAHAARYQALAAQLTAMQAQTDTIARVTNRRWYTKVGGALKRGGAAVVAGAIGYTIGSVR